MANIASLGVVLGLDSAEFNAGMKQAETLLDGFQEKLVELAGIAAFAEMVNKSLEYANSIEKTAKANDVATASVLQLSEALEKNGGSAEDTSRIYSGFTQKLESAVSGNLKVQQSFQKVGVSLNDLKTLSEQDLFEKTISGLATMRDSAERNGLAFQLLGRGIKGVDIVGLNKDLEESKGSFDKYSASIQQAHQLSIELEAASKKLTLTFTAAVIPSLKLVYDDLTQSSTAMATFGSVLENIAAGAAITFAAIKVDVLQLWDVVKGTVLVLRDAANPALWGQIENDTKNALNEMQLDWSKYQEFVAKASMPPQAIKPENQDNANRNVVNGLAKQIGAVNALTEAYKNQQDLILQGLKDKESDIYLTKNQKELNDAINKVILERDRMIGEINKKQEAAKGTVGGGAIIADLEKQKQKVYELTGAYVDLTVQQVQQSQAAQQTFSNGWDKAFNQYVESGSNAAQQGQQSFNAVTSAMDSALTQFVEKGKINFKSLAATILEQLVLIQAKAAMTQIFSGASGLFGGLMGGLFGGGNAFTNPASGGSFTGANFQLASGGPMTGGSPYLVGENGPELVVPQTGGTVIPNNKLADVMGANQGSGITYNGPYIANMSAIDTQSATQFLAANQNAVWGAYQNAQRSLPQTR
jgi:lambda family phage tail tape measure protein